LEIERTEIEEVEDYTYLGQVVSFREGMEKELRARKSRAWNGFWALKGIFKGEMNLKSKIKIWEMCVLPVLCYGAQTWAITKSRMEALRSTQRAMERSILKIKKKDRVRNELVRKKTNIKDVGFAIKKAKFKYAGYIMRGNEDRWKKRTTMWMPYGGRGEGALEGEMKG